MLKRTESAEAETPTFLGYPRPIGIIALVIALSLSVVIAFLMAPFSP